jgi:hypothetical protein
MASCEFENNSEKNDNIKDIGFINRLQTSYSPNKKYNFTVTEYGIDSTDAVTQVLVNFKHAALGAYAVSGLNKKLKVYWKGNSTIVIETLKSYKPTQRLPQVGSFDDIIKIEYFEK